MNINTPRISGKLLYIALSDYHDKLRQAHMKALETNTISGDTQLELIAQIQDICALGRCLDAMDTDNASATYGYMLESYKYPSVLPKIPANELPEWDASRIESESKLRKD